MRDLVKVNLFSNDKDNYERCKLTSLLFKDIDYSLTATPVSFYRSDFSRSQFNNCTFSKNIFGRSDFVDIYAVNTEFNMADFGSCMMKNAMFEKVQFQSNRYNGVAIQYSYFYKCTFRDETFVTNMFETTFEQCTFVNCKFEKSSLDHISICNCELIKTDISECWAENLRFDKCTLRDVYLGVNLWPTYLYRDTDINNFGYKYRGNIVNLWFNSPEEFLGNLLQEEKYFEYLNAVIIGHKTVAKDLIEEFESVMPLVFKQPLLTRKSNMTRILEMLLFYSNFSAIEFHIYVEAICLLKQYNWSKLPFEEQLTYQSLLYKIEQNFEHFGFSLQYLLNIPRDKLCIATFHLDFENAAEAKAYLNNIYNIANEEIGGIYEQPLIEVLEEKSGTIILTVVTVATLTLFISYVAKIAVHNLCSIHIKSVLRKEIAKEIKNAGGSISKLQKASALAKDCGLLAQDGDIKTVQKLSAELSKGEIIDMVLQLLT